MKIVLVSVAALLIGLGGGVGVAFLRAPSAKAAVPVAADSTSVAARDSASAPAAAADSGLAHAAHADSAARGGMAPDTSHAVAADPMGLPVFPPMKNPIPDSLTTPTYRPVARLLMNMKPADAGKVLSYLNDTQVEGILRVLGARQAAVLLSQMPAERAAQLSRRLMLPVGGGT
ncbi:MAG: hypothetical protein ACRENS_05440 [Candidatus Eiseniibacteriota bacterium]